VAFYILWLNWTVPAPDLVALYDLEPTGLLSLMFPQMARLPDAMKSGKNMNQCPWQNHELLIIMILEFL